MRAEIISVGTELLLGDIVNTNARFLARELAALGIHVFRQTVVGDNTQRIMDALETAHQHNEWVIVTGGLGPTTDDITRECVAQLLERALEFDARIWEQIVRRLTKRTPYHTPTDNNKKQAMVPVGAMVLPNHCGTAPGLLLTHEQRHIVVLPGPPREMMAMFRQSVVPLLQQSTQEVLKSYYLRLYGIGESALEELLQTILDEQTNPTVALYAKTGEVMIRITARGASELECQRLIDKMCQMIRPRIAKYLYAEGDERMSDSETELNNVVGKQLMERSLTMSIAESLTGGQLTSQLIEVSGISQVLLESIVCYSNSSKIRSLNVSETLIEQYGAVSPECAAAMVEGVQQHAQSDIAIATTGVAGPHSDEKKTPVGTVYIALRLNNDTIVHRYKMSGTRQEIRDKTCREALYLLWQSLNKNSHCKNDA